MKGTATMSKPVLRIAQILESKTPKLTKAHTKAGITEIRARNFNGSYVCIVDLRKVDLNNTQSNPRRYSKAHSNKLLADWRDESVRNPILRYKAGKLTSIDGRHTTWSILAQTDSDDDQVLMTCDVHFDISNATAARIFYNLTVNNKRISPWDAFATALAAEMEHAIDINRALNSYRLTTPNSEGYNTRTCDVSAYTPVLEAYHANKGTLETLCFILDQTYRLHGRVAKDAKDVEFMRGLIDMIQSPQCRYYSRMQFVNRLMRRSASEVDARASEIAYDRNETRPNRQDYCRALIEVATLNSNRVAG